jgi:uncharacterized membrane protein
VDWKILSSIFLVLAGTIISGYYYPTAPDSFVTRWDGLGQPSGYMRGDVGLFLIPSVMGALVLLFHILPHVDPTKKNTSEIRESFGRFTVIITLFLFLIHLQVISSNMGLAVNPASTMPLLMGALFYFTGDIIGSIKRNWFMGIRTPWTLSSERVWRKTHHLGGMLFKVCGFISVLGVIAPELAVYLMVAPAVISAIYLSIYSYLEYKKGR